VSFVRYVEKIVVPDRPQVTVKYCTRALHAG